MFIKWAIEVVGEWYTNNQDGVQIAYIMYVVSSWVVVGTTALFVVIGKTDKYVMWIWQIACPFFIVTSIVPSCLFIGWKLGKCIRNLYSDYQYFAANGGKRKREDTDGN